MLRTVDSNPFQVKAPICDLEQDAASAKRLHSVLEERRLDLAFFLLVSYARSSDTLTQVLLCSINQSRCVTDLFISLV